MNSILRYKKRIFIVILAIAALLFAVVSTQRSDEQWIEATLGCEVPTARVLKTDRRGDCYAIYFQMSEEDRKHVDALFEGSWLPLRKSAAFELGKPGEYLTELSGVYAHTNRKFTGIPYVVRMDDGVTYIAIRANAFWDD